MRNEDSCKAFERYLIADSYLPEHAVKLWQDYTEQRFLNKDKNDFYHNYVSWKQKDNQIAVFTTRSYADLEMNKKI
ncbi:hypothetical protein ACFFWB_23980 [Flavobacterium procerum]|uniref:hypothetical protein n=1 Tax=Flavobacterium procerum TaxID=1455569 RepID=UPI0035EBD2E1